MYRYMGVGQILYCVNSLEMATLPRWVTKLGQGGAQGAQGAAKTQGRRNHAPGAVRQEHQNG